MAATIHKFPASANIVEGEKYTLKCEVYGTLLDMEVKWYKDGGLITCFTLKLANIDSFPFLN